MERDVACIYETTVTFRSQNLPFYSTWTLPLPLPLTHAHSLLIVYDLTYHILKVEVVCIQMY